MKIIKLFFWGLLALILVFGVGRFIQKQLDRQYDQARLPYLQMPSHHSVYIHWQDIKAQIGEIRFGTRPDNLTQIVREDTPSKIHQIKLAGLKPDTVYWYQINKKSYSFRTAPDPNTTKEVLFWVLGDPGLNSNILQSVRDSALKAIGNRHIDLILSTGDNAYPSGTNLQFQLATFEPFAQLLSQVSYLPAYGNHDARRESYFDIFNFPTKGELGGVSSDTEAYFSLDYGPVHLVFLNSEYSFLSRRKPMEKWLKQDLKLKQKRWTIVLFHSPPYTKGSHNSDSWRDSLGRMEYMRENILPILESADVDLVLSGHSHSYERSHLMRCHYDNSSYFDKRMVLDSDGMYQKSINSTRKGGAVYLVLGSSAKVDGGTFDHPAMPIAHQKAGSLLLQIGAKKLTAQFIGKEAQVIDAFSIEKNAITNYDASCGLK